MTPYDFLILLLGFSVGFVGAKVWFLSMQIYAKSKKPSETPRIKLVEN